MSSPLEYLDRHIHQHHYPTSLLRLVFLDLVLSKLWKNVQLFPVENLNTSIILAHEPDTPPDQYLVILPISQEDTLSMKRISDMFKALDGANIRQIQGDGLKKITLAIVSPDSTIVYYHISRGLVPPKS
ncbi:tRNA intron endonuclease [Radiomyces spectabilis]|uniref:tRNA intron endonuclease n=1 Tax=Radiomyces spectabilis TaxID=64574 RepID=UPI0022205C56|nr:tRNA intron endonuclease [Radiomyces spectabilis]KAI8371625.1 tRNA intron endonuclease [Radiomyces spectabilis]